jgi:transposase
MPTLPPYIIEPISEQVRTLLPDRDVTHPLGCHRPRICDRVIFEKLVQILGVGCAYWRIADETCSATTLRRRRDEWIEAGVMEQLRGLALAAYDRVLGLRLSDIAIDCCITKAPCGGEKAGKSPVDRVSGASSARWRWTQAASLWAPSRLPTLGRDAGGARRGARAGDGASRPRLRFGGYARASEGSRPDSSDLREGQARSATGYETLGSGAHKLLE